MCDPSIRQENNLSCYYYNYHYYLWLLWLLLLLLLLSLFRYFIIIIVIIILQYPNHYHPSKPPVSACRWVHGDLRPVPRYGHGDHMPHPRRDADGLGGHPKSNTWKLFKSHTSMALPESYRSHVRWGLSKRSSSDWYTPESPGGFERALRSAGGNWWWVRDRST